nr:signal peptidase I [Vicinamibacterales bacterium]
MLASIWLGAHPRRTLARSLALVAASAVLFGVVLKPIRASGVSMEPAYEAGALLFCNTLAYRARGPARGEVVAIRLAGPSVVMVKRVVGLPGEAIRISSGVVMVDGVPLDEPYVKRRQPWDYEEVVVGADEYFVIGDNRSM